MRARAKGVVSPRLQRTQDGPACLLGTCPPFAVSCDCARPVLLDQFKMGSRILPQLEGTFASLLACLLVMMRNYRQKVWGVRAWVPRYTEDDVHMHVPVTKLVLELFPRLQTISSKASVQVRH